MIGSFRRATSAVAIAAVLAACSSGGDDPSRSANPEAEEQADQLLAETSNQTELTQQIVADEIVSAEEQEQAIEELFVCYSAVGVTPSSPEWNGTIYVWEVDTNTADVALSDERSAEMFQCEERHWNFVQSYVSATSGSSELTGDEIDQLIVDCINGKGLDGDSWLAGDTAVIETEEAATCFEEVTSNAAAPGE